LYVCRTDNAVFTIVQYIYALFRWLGFGAYEPFNLFLALCLSKLFRFNQIDVIGPNPRKPAHFFWPTRKHSLLFLWKICEVCC